MESSEPRSFKNKRENYARILTEAESDLIWSFLEEKFGIPSIKYKNEFSFAQNKRGRLWIASKEALAFVEKDRFDPAKVLTCAVGKSDSKKLLQDNEMHIRLTIDGAMFFNSDITKNILYISETEKETWQTGEVIDKSTSNIPNDIYVLAAEETKLIIGSTIAKNGYLLNFVPKWRRPDRLAEVRTDFDEPENVM